MVVSIARKDGWVSARSTIKCKKKELINECLEPEMFYDDWCERRDGMRGYNDRKSIRNKNMVFAEYLQVEKYNKKNKKLVQRRKAQKKHPRRVYFQDPAMERMYRQLLCGGMHYRKAQKEVVRRFGEYD